jgi:hypothetical protein
VLQWPSLDPLRAQQWLAQSQPAAAQAQVRLTIKLPCQLDWLPCICAVQPAEQAVLLMGLSNPVQLLWAQSLGVACIAPHVGRLTATPLPAWFDTFQTVRFLASGGFLEK